MKDAFANLHYSAVKHFPLHLKISLLIAEGRSIEPLTLNKEISEI